MKPSIPKGTRDFSPLEMARRNYILDTIKTVYQRYGFQQIETPAMENLETLTGKYGDEGDKLIFKILNSGDFLETLKDIHDVFEDNNNVDKSKFPSPTALVKDLDSKKSLNYISEKALRYDLTVPFARYVVMHQNEITFPFKRYQIQPVWRADRPQKGRYREFVQCDADVIGSASLLNEAELICIIADVFTKLEIGYTIKLNNRKVLYGLVDFLQIKKDQAVDFAILIDKIDKLGIDAVKTEILKIGIQEEKLNQIINYLAPTDMKIGAYYISERANELKLLFQTCNSQVGLEGIEEIITLMNYFTGIGEIIPPIDKRIPIQFDSSLARGLNYYTGAIFEVKVNDSRSTFTSSILGGGRYDDLTGIFGLPNVSGVGISFGVDRIYDVMEEMKLFDQLNLQSASTQILFVNFGKEEERHCLKLVSQVRDAGINAEIYPEAAKMKKQMSYADDKKIPYVVLVGSEEIKSGILTVKNMKSGEQEKITIENLISKLK